MKFQPLKQIPAFIAVGVIALVGLLAAARLDFFERLENITYDWRARTALQFPTAVATNLGFVQIDDETIDAVKSGELGYSFGLYWPRQVYARIVHELSAQGAETIGFDVLFGEARDDHKGVVMSDGTYVDSDEYFAREIRQAGNVVLAATTNLSPPEIFSAAAAALGNIATDKDADGILRRARAFTWHRRWHPALRELESKPDSGINLRRARIEAGHLLIPLGRTSGEELDLPLDAENRFTLNPEPNVSNAVPQKYPAFTLERVWHLGVVMAARHLKLDLTTPEVDLEHGRITLRNPEGGQRIIPVDQDGYFLVNWALRTEDARLTVAPGLQLLRQNRERALNQPITPGADWQGKIVVVGSSAQGNDLTDLGATPLDKTAFLVSKHWNVANSIITNRFVHKTTLLQEIGLIAGLGLLTAFLTWQLRVLPGLFSMLMLAAGYTGICAALFILQRIWLPMVLPITGALFVQYSLLVTYRVVFEQRARRKIKSVFSKIVAPDVVNELLEADQLALGGARRVVTVMFADVRGFTEMTDKVQEETAEQIRKNKLAPEAAEACYDAVAQQTLQTISLYLGLIADTVKKHNGTLDKYIGDCAMAFWGAPKQDPAHAANCVRAAVEAQRGIHDLNEQRRQANEQLQQENQTRAAAGQPPKLLLPLLTLGTGINSGAVMVGLMGSDDHGLNYTVLGREVNLASRLEGVSGRGRIIIGETTYEYLQQSDPALAASCIEQEPTKPKGFQRAVRNFEVPWQSSNSVPAPTPPPTRD